MNKFDTREATVTYLTENKYMGCATALTAEFDAGLEKGLTFREAYYYAETRHFLADHDGHDHLPELAGHLDSDEAVRADIQEDIDEGTHANEATSFLNWYNRVRSWDVPLELAYTTALEASMIEWEDNNDVDEAEVIASINEIPSEEVVDFLLREFYAKRNKGNSVRTSLREARDAYEERAQMQALFALFSGALDGGQDD
jgi:sulfur relay (sulfurtransferase) DsrC/TusE family protein